MSKLTVSVVVPVYNEEKVIKLCLESIAEQSVQPLEVIVVDNNSRDSTVDIAKTFPFVTVLHERRQGIIPARTAGCNAAKGDIIARLDADTVLSSGWVEQVVAHFQNDNDLIACGGVAGLAELSPKGRFWFKWVQDIIRRGDIKRYGVVHMYGHNMAFRKTAWKKARPYLSDGSDAALEDLDLSFALSLQGKVAIKRDLIAKIHGLRSIDVKKYLRYGKEGLVTKQKYERLRK